MLELVSRLDTLERCSFSDLLLSACDDTELTTFILRNAYAVNVLVNDYRRLYK